MKKGIFYPILMVCLAQVVTVSSLQGEEVGVTFLFRLNEMLHRVDPEQKLQDDLLETRLRSMLSRARKLRREHHLALQKGLKSKLEADVLEKEGRELIHEVLGMTESYLEGRLKSLKKHREELVDALMPKEKQP